MKNKTNRIFVVFLLFLVFIGINSCSIVDINDDNSVIKRMQGTWVGYDHANGIYTHYKLQISENNFKGWLTTAYTDDEPIWDDQPIESGYFTLSPVQGYTNLSGKYRNINFYNENGGLGNNSLAARSFTEMIIYDEQSGLYVVSWAAMNIK